MGNRIPRLPFCLICLLHAACSALKDEHIFTILDEHNKYRARQDASNMIHLMWDRYLANMATDWAELCMWKMGKPHRNASIRPYVNIGQHMHLNAQILQPNFSKSVAYWYKDSAHYTYDTGRCNVTSCAAYKQIVNAKTMGVGCDYKYCTNIRGTDRVKKGLLVVCYYGPALVPNSQPYRKGPTCSRCPAVYPHCHDDLCLAHYKDQKTQYECKLECDNCGRVNREQCSCECPAGYSGRFCSEKCGNALAICFFMKPEDCTEFFKSRCPLLCGLCEEPAPLKCDLSSNKTNAVSTTTQKTTARRPTSTTTTATTTTTTATTTTTSATKTTLTTTTATTTTPLHRYRQRTTKSIKTTRKMAARTTTRKSRKSKESYKLVCPVIMPKSEAMMSQQSTQLLMTSAFALYVLSLSQK